MEKGWAWINAIFEKTGIVWIWEIFRDRVKYQHDSTFPESSSEIRECFGKLVDEPKIQEALEYCQSIFEDSQERITNLEGKATGLMGITGISTGLITGILGLLLNLNSEPLWFVILVAVLFVLTVIGITWTLFLCFKVLKVGSYVIAYPDPKDIFLLNDGDAGSVRFERAVALFQSFALNHNVALIKADYLIGAQQWFRNSVLFLLIIALTLAVYLPFHVPDIPEQSPPVIPSLIGERHLLTK